MTSIIVGQLANSEGTGFRIFSIRPTASFNIWVNSDGKVQISDTVSKEDFLDLMSKLYDMAEVK